MPNKINKNSLQVRVILRYDSITILPTFYIGIDLSTFIGICILDQGAATLNLSAKGCEWMYKDLNGTQGPKRNPYCFRGLMMN